jgi:hypothetical protein
MKLPAVLLAAPKPKKEKAPVVVTGLPPSETWRKIAFRDDEPFIAPWNDWHDPDPPVKYVKEPEIPALFEERRFNLNHADWLVKTGYIAYASPEAAARIWKICVDESRFVPAYVMKRMIGFIGEQTIEGLLQLAQRGFYEEDADTGTRCEIIACLARVDSPEVARFMAKARSKLAGAMEDVVDWTLRLPRTAAIGFVPLAVGPLGDERVAARAGLRHLSRRGHADVVRAAAKANGEEVERAIEALLDEDPIAADACSHGKLPPFFDAAALTSCLLYKYPSPRD